MRLLILLLIIISPGAWAQMDLASKASAFLNQLPEKLRTQAQYQLTDEERFNWHFVPKSRNGVSLRDLNESQKQAALDLLRSSMSIQGYDKATAIMALENVLIAVEHRDFPTDRYRDPSNYFITIFGKPESNGYWGWRFEGHHVAINFSTAKNKIESSTPSFFGSNPGIIMEGKDRGKQVLKAETEAGLALINSFDEAQLKKAVIAEEALKEIVSVNKRKAEPIEPAGVSYKDLNDGQKQNLIKLLEIYVKNYELGFSKKLMDKIIAAGIENLNFAWAGGKKEGLAYYYRIQGPMLLIELDNTQNNANHVHTVVRDLTNDFGEDILREHYAKEHN
ncbi:MAG: DUF3500 domain-containing protein [Chryseolinea sp.]